MDDLSLQINRTECAAKTFGVKVFFTDGRPYGKAFSDQLQFICQPYDPNSIGLHYTKEIGHQYGHGHPRTNVLRHAVNHCYQYDIVDLLLKKLCAKILPQKASHMIILESSVLCMTL